MAANNQPSSTFFESYYFQLPQLVCAIHYNNQIHKHMYWICTKLSGYAGTLSISVITIKNVNSNL